MRHSVLGLLASNSPARGLTVAIGLPSNGPVTYRYYGQSVRDCILRHAWLPVTHRPKSQSLVIKAVLGLRKLTPVPGLEVTALGPGELELTVRGICCPGDMKEHTEPGTVLLFVNAK